MLSWPWGVPIYSKGCLVARWTSTVTVLSAVTFAHVYARLKPGNRLSRYANAVRLGRSCNASRLI